MHILLIDTDPNLRRVLTEMLEWMGHTVKASAGKEVAQLQSGEGLEGVDAVIVHHAPPSLDGSCVTTVHHAHHSRVPVVMIADRVDGGTEIVPQQPEGAYVIRQPVSVGAMRHILRRALADE